MLGAVLSSGCPSGLGLGSRRDGVRGHCWFCFSLQVCAPSGTYSVASFLSGCADAYSGCLQAICRQRVCTGACDRLQ